MKKGFTLIEMIAVVGILALMTLLILPNMLNLVNNKKNELSETTKKVIYTALDLYLNNNSDSYPKLSGNTYCVTLQELVDANYLKQPILDAKTGKEISLKKGVSTTVDIYGQYDNYELGDC